MGIKQPWQSYFQQVTSLHSQHELKDSTIKRSTALSILRNISKQRLNSRQWRIRWMLVCRSKGSNHPLVFHVAVMLNVPVLSVETTASHRSHVVGMCVSFKQLMPHVIRVMRAESPLQELKTQRVFNRGRIDDISYTDSLFFSILTRCCLVPIQGMK